MKAVQAKIQEAGLRADGRQLSELVKVKLQGAGNTEQGAETSQ